MSTVWKFPLNLYGPDGNVTDSPTVDMPDGSQILTLRLQRGQPTLWALVDPDAPLERRRFAIVGTGQAMPDGPTRYVGTWMSDEDGTFVFHVFEEDNVSETIETEKIQRLDIKPGEILIVKLARGLDQSQMQHVRDAIMERMPEGVEVLVTTGDIEFGVVTRAVPQTVPPPPPLHDNRSLGEYFGQEPPE